MERIVCLAESKLETLDHWVIGLYLVLSIGLGLWFVRRGTKDSKAYIAGSGAIPWWIAGTSLLVACFAADTPLWLGDIIYKRGLEGMWLYWAPAVGTAFFIMFIAPLWKRSGILTDVELMEVRYTGKAAAAMRVLNALFHSGFVGIMFMALQMLSIATILSTITDWDKTRWVWVTMILAGSYSVISGLWGVASSGAMQFLVTYIGSVILAIYAVVHEVGGVSALVEGVRNLSESWPQGADLEVMPNPSSPMALPVMTLVLLFGFRWMEQMGMGGYVAQRVIASKNSRQGLYTAMIWGVGFFAVVPLPWIITILAAKIRLPEITNGQEAYPSMAMLLPAGLKGVLIASMLAAFMSTYSSLMSWGSSYFVNDCYRRFIKKDAGERHYVIGGQLFMVLMALISSVIALYAENCLNVIMVVLTVMSGLWSVMVIRWIWWRANAWTEVAGLVASIFFSLLSYLLPWTRLWWAPDNLEAMMGQRIIFIVVGTLVSWLIVTLLTNPVNSDVLDAFYRKVRPPGFWGPVTQRLGMRPSVSLGTIIYAWILMILGIYGPLLGMLKWSLGESALGAGLTAVGIAAIAMSIRQGRKMYSD